MPAFVKNGPNIPDKLLQAHEEGRVVFFCGAGISSAAQLPIFDDLVGRLYEKFDVSPDSAQKSAIKLGQYDKAIELLEATVVGGRKTVRNEIVRILKPDLNSPNATVTHDSLLTLSKSRDERVRLVTTNFDRLFQEVISTKQLDVEHFTAPLLPVPKNRWDGLVYLHGLVPANPTPEKLDQLVISSGDFGLAYLTERWAARFVSELFQNFIVCFIGYSINDPVLRYMMDALAADRLLGENVLETFAFGSFSKGKEDQVTREWISKNVTPILYQKHKNHTYLRRTLKVWADTYRDGVSGKKMIITQHSVTPPLSSSRSDFTVGRLLWALTDKNVAKYFADMNPVPPLDWLRPLAENQFGHEDLERFGVTPNRTVDKNLQFSFISRPAPYTLAERMQIAGSGYQNRNWDDVMYQLARWLTRHLDDPKLIIWLARQGGQLNSQFTRQIHYRIKELYELSNKGKQNELDKIKKHAPKAIPGPLMRNLWQLFLAGRINSYMDSLNLLNWFDRCKQAGLTPILRMELNELLTPRITIREPFDFQIFVEATHKPKQIRDLVNWELALSSEHVHDTIRDFKNEPSWQTALPELLQDFTVLLRDAIDLKKALSGADNWSDRSYIDQPSISEHSQNNTYSDWTALINLTRDAWLAMVQISPKQARLVAETWWQHPYPLFKRLSLFAAATSNVINSRVALSWLLSDRHWWLWSVETRREMFRLLVSLSPTLNVQGIARLEKAILQGPPHKMYKGDTDSNRLKKFFDNEIWIRLAKLESTDLELSLIAKSKLHELSQENPNWKLASDERDEFTFWTSSEDDWRKFVTSPPDLDELMAWLMQPSDDFFQEDDWHQRCRDDFNGSFKALHGLAKKNKWPVKRWQKALQVWRDEELLKVSWSKIPKILVDAPDNVIGELSHSLSLWLQAESSYFTENDEQFFLLCRRVLSCKCQSSSVIDDDLLTVAINHPVGQTTQAILNWWYRQDLKDEEGLSDPMKSIITELCDIQNQEYRHGRILLAAHSISLFRVDRDWTINILLPVFNWHVSKTEASGAWMGFLWSPRRYDPLLSVIKQYFLDTASHYNRLGKYASRYAAFLTFEALDPGDVITTTELKKATKELPIEGLQSSVRSLIRALEGAAEQRSEFWQNRIVPYLNSIWPKTKQVVAPEISLVIGELCIVAQNKFPDAVNKLLPWLEHISRPQFLAYQLNISELCKEFPKDSLTFLDAIFRDNLQWGVGDLMQCLSDIIIADDSLAIDSRFLRLKELC